MFALAIIIGTYSFLLLAVGIAGVLTIFTVLVLTLVFALCALGLIYIEYRKLTPLELKLRLNYSHLLFIPLLLLILINLWGALLPEIAFDALWYHLTIPKIFLAQHGFKHIPGGVFYYSDMPKLIDLLFIPSVLAANETFAKLTHFMFGILTLIALFRFSRLFLSFGYSLIVLLVFYSSLVVAWQSTTAFIDLGRTFFELLTFIGVYKFLKTKKPLWLVEGAVMMGFAISSKLVSFYSIIIFSSLLLLDKTSFIKTKIKNVVIFVIASLLVPLPYFILSYLSTGNPIYPFIFNGLSSDLSLIHLSPIKFVSDVTYIFLFSQDPINPIYIILFPIIFLNFRPLYKKQKFIAIYSIIALISWYISPRTGGGRFLMAYLPVLSLFVVLALNEVKSVFLKKFTLAVIVFISLVAIFYRFAAQIHSIDYVTGKTSKAAYLSNNLNFDFGDFYDTDGYFESHIKGDDRVLIYGYHNLYYVDFPFVHESYVKSGDEFNYILTGKDITLPSRFKYWDLVYENPKTYAKLYTFGGIKWQY